MVVSRIAGEAAGVFEGCPFKGENVCRNLNRAETIFGHYETDWRNTSEALTQDSAY
jgi:hypothetical protein